MDEVEEEERGDEEEAGKEVDEEEIEMLEEVAEVGIGSLVEGEVQTAGREVEVEEIEAGEVSCFSFVSFRDFAFFLKSQLT